MPLLLLLFVFLPQCDQEIFLVSDHLLFISEQLLIDFTLYTVIFGILFLFFFKLNLFLKTFLNDFFILVFPMNVH
jgi:hypothetical protein